MNSRIKAAGPSSSEERVLRGLLAAAGAVLFLAFSAMRSAAAPMPNEREQMRHAPTIGTPAETRQGVQDAYKVLMSARLSSFYNPGADAEYNSATYAYSDEDFLLAN